MQPGFMIQYSHPQYFQLSLIFHNKRLQSIVDKQSQLSELNGKLQNGKFSSDENNFNFDADLTFAPKAEKEEENSAFSGNFLPPYCCEILFCHENNFFKGAKKARGLVKMPSWLVKGRPSWLMFITLNCVKKFKTPTGRNASVLWRHKYSLCLIFVQAS